MVELETLIVLGVPNGKDAEKLHEIVPALYAHEAVIDARSLEPQRAYHVAKLVSDASRRTAIFADSSRIDEAARICLATGAELVLLVSDGIEDYNVFRKLQAAYEQGVETVSVYVECKPPDCPRITRSVSRLTSELGLPVHLRIGPPFYKSVDAQSFEKMILQLGRPGLPYGLLYGYTARRIRLENDMFATILEPPCPRDCRRITFTQQGVCKCPFVKNKTVPYNMLTIDEVERLSSSCCGKGAEAVDADIRVKLSIVYNGVEIPEDVLKVLFAVKMTKSFRAACLMLGYNPSHMIVKVRRVESRIGARLLDGHRGGRGGGYSELTRVGEQIVKKYVEAKSLLKDLE